MNFEYFSENAKCPECETNLLISSIHSDNTFLCGCGKSWHRKVKLNRGGMIELILLYFSDDLKISIGKNQVGFIVFRSYYHIDPHVVKTLFRCDYIPDFILESKDNVIRKIETLITFQ